MTRFLLTYFLILLLSAFVTSCRTQKNVSGAKQQSSITTQTTQTDESKTSSTDSRTDSSWTYQGNRIHRDGILWIEFDSLARIDIAPDGAIRATGYAPTLRSHTSETRADTSASLVTSGQFIQKDSTGSTDILEEQTVESSTEIETKQVTRTPTLIPWIGVGLAVAVVVLAVLWWFTRSHPSK